MRVDHSSLPSSTSIPAVAADIGEVGLEACEHFGCSDSDFVFHVDYSGV